MDQVLTLSSLVPSLDMDHDLITLDGQLGFHAMGQIKVMTPENSNQLEVDQNRTLKRKPIVKSETLSNIEGLHNYVPQRTNALLETKYEDLQHKVPEKSIPTDDSVIDWLNGWIDGKTVHPNFMGFMDGQWTSTEILNRVSVNHQCNNNI